MTYKWYLFDQNNSGGYYCPPALFVYVEASSSDEAYERFQEDVIFKGNHYYSECEECCGPRWGYRHTSVFDDEPLVQKISEYEGCSAAEDNVTVAVKCRIGSDVLEEIPVEVMNG